MILLDKKSERFGEKPECAQDFTMAESANGALRKWELMITEVYVNLLSGFWWL